MFIRSSRFIRSISCISSNTRNTTDTFSKLRVVYEYVCCLFSWRYNPLWLYFHSPVAGFSLLVFEVS
jgi:hypothetical protein